MSATGDQRKLFKKLRKLDCEVRRSNSGHFIILHRPTGCRISMASTPSDTHGLNQAIRDLRKIGVPV